MTEQQAIEALHALPRLPRSGASLERMQALLDHLGNPEKQFKCIHIAGTNGKGTLAAMTSSILTHAGYKTGLTISPYVLNFRERFQINGQMMSPRTLASLTRKVLDAADAIIAEGGEGPVDDPLDHRGVLRRDVQPALGQLPGNNFHAGAFNIGGQVVLRHHWSFPLSAGCARPMAAYTAARSRLWRTPSASRSSCWVRYSCMEIGAAAAGSMPLRRQR